MSSNRYRIKVVVYSHLWLLLLLVLILSLAGCVWSDRPDQSDGSLSIPAQSDWTDYGLILKTGALGEWDYQLAGGFTATAVKKDGTYYLYYQGSSGYRTSFDETPTGRAIGVATSPDGVNFTKSSNNPILVWSPNNEGEEGAVSGGVTLDDNGEIVLYYGANTAQNATAVSADGRLATSEDGLNFTDRGVVLDHTDGSIWGSGDELFPIIAFHNADQWFVYYLPNGSPQRRHLGVVWGDKRDELTRSSAVRNKLRTIPAWGTGGHAKIGPDAHALFLNGGNPSQIEVRRMSSATPNRLSEPIETYQFDQVRQATVLLDEETNTWFMFYLVREGFGLKLAPAGQPDETPPSAPANVSATPISDRQIDLTWSPATDLETGIVLYQVFRDGTHIGTVKGWHFSDMELVEQTNYSYQVSAINTHGVQGAQSDPVTAVTLVDLTPPSLVGVNASGSSDQISVVFDEPVDEPSAETVMNYAINQGISVTGASLKPDRRTVVLNTSEHRHGATYSITINNVRDRAETSNSIEPDTEVRYTHSQAAGLVGVWTFDEGKGNRAFDTANFGNHGLLTYIDKPGPSWTTGRMGGALQFDGVDDQVTIDGSGYLEDITDGSHSFVAWANPATVPPNSTVNNTFYSILVRQYTGLYYDNNRKFKAQTRLSDRTEVAVSSEVFEPGTWHLLAMVVDDTNDKLHLYVDGREVTDSPISYEGELADHKDAPFYVGTSEPLTEKYEFRFQGDIDEVRIYDRALNLLEVQALFADSLSR